MNLSKILFIVFLVLPLSTSFAQDEPPAFLDVAIEEEEVPPPPPPPPRPSRYACKTCDGYSVISDFEKGIRAVKNEYGEIGFINDQETLVIPLEYETYNRIDENRIIIYKDRFNCGVIDFNNKVIIPLEYYSISKISNDNYKVSKDNKYGILNTNGKEIIPTEYKSISLIHGIFIVEKNDKKGFFDINGNTILDPIYKYINSYGFNHFICQAPDNSNIIDMTTHKKLFKGKYNKLTTGSNRLLIANKNNKMGLIDISEEVLIPFDYEAIESFNDNLYLISKNGNYGLYDLFQKMEVVQLEYEEIRKMKGGYRLKKEGKYGFAYPVKNQLELIIPIEYDEIVNMDNGLVKLTKNKKDGVFNIFSRKEILPISYDKIKRYAYANYNNILAQKGGKTSILNGRYFIPIIDKEFDRVKYKSGFLVCLQNDKYYLYNIKGHPYQEQVDYLEVLTKYFVKVKKGNKWGIYSAKLMDFIIPCEHDKLSFDPNRNMLKIGADNYKIRGDELTKQ